MGTDTNVGMTWHKCGKMNVCQWFDGVDTKLKHVDGLSRGKHSGDWDIVPLAFLGAELSCDLRRARRFAPS